MTAHTCPRCGKEFKYTTHLANHLSRKNPCPALHSNVDPDVLLEEFNMHKATSCHCEKCGKAFANTTALKYHNDKKVCDRKPRQVNTNAVRPNTTVTNFIVTNFVTNAINTSNTSNTIVNPYLNTSHMFDARYFDVRGKNDFGKERLDYITPELIREYLQDVFDISKLIQIIYFNPHYPENNNIALYNSKKDQYITVRDGRVLLQDITYVSYTIKKTMHKLVNGYCEENKELLEKIIQHEKNAQVATPDKYYDLQVFQKELAEIESRMEWLQRNIMAIKNARMDSVICTQIESHTRPIGTPEPLPHEAVYLPDTNIPVSDSSFWPTSLLTQPPKPPLSSTYSDVNTTSTQQVGQICSDTQKILSITEDDISTVLKRMFGDGAPDLGTHRYGGWD